MDISLEYIRSISEKPIGELIDVSNLDFLDQETKDLLKKHPISNGVVPSWFFKKVGVSKYEKLLSILSKAKGIYVMSDLFRYPPNFRSMVQYALDYRRLGLSVIPVTISKNKPRIRWSEFQTRLPEPEEIKDWWTKYPSANVAIVTGHLSGLAVVEITPYAVRNWEGWLSYYSNAINIMDFVPHSIIPRGEHHLYFAYPENLPRDVSMSIRGTRFKGEGEYVIAPRSRVNGYKCWWKVYLCAVDLPQLPERLFAVIEREFPAWKELRFRRYDDDD